MNYREVLDILTTPGYVSMIEGPPGSGKTFLALKACAKRGRATYMSFAEPDHSLRQKLTYVEPGFSGEFKVVSLLSGKPDYTFGLVKESLERGEVVVIDSLDALLYGITKEEDVRPFLQILYASAKQGDGSLIMVAEDVNPNARQLGFVADALIRINVVEVLDEKVKQIIVLKDRDYEIENSVYYFSFFDKGIHRPLKITQQKAIGKARLVEPPPFVSQEAIYRSGAYILLVHDQNIPDDVIRLYREFFAADYLQKGYVVNYILGPNETEEVVLGELHGLAGDLYRNVKLVKVNPRAASYRADELYRQVMGQLIKGEKVVDQVNLLAYEEFAAKDPVEFELYVNMAIRETVEAKKVTALFGTPQLRATDTEMKYASQVRRLTILNGFLFVRSIKPMSPLYLVEIDPELGNLTYSRLS